MSGSIQNNERVAFSIIPPKGHQMANVDHNLIVILKVQVETSESLTSRTTKPRSKSLAISHGYGNLIDTRNTLRIPNTFVRPYSITPCNKMLRARLRSDHAATRTCFSPTLPRFLPVGNPSSPCALKVTAAEGARTSKRKNVRDGTR
jgi:hypothetical protein